MRFLALCALVACGSSPSEEGCHPWYPDADGDGYGAVGMPLIVCEGDDVTGLVNVTGDCRDNDPLIYPFAEERCDDVDNDCDGELDAEDDSLVEGVATWLDADLDGFGDPTSETLLLCDVPYERADNPWDCDDDDQFTHPGAAYNEENAAACTTDVDGDGFGSDAPAPGAIAGSDCDDRDDDVHPQAKERLDDGIDQDCSRTVDWFILDELEEVTAAPLLRTLQNAALVPQPAFSGGSALKLEGDAEVQLRELDTTSPEAGVGCENLWWSMRVRRGPELPALGSFLALQALGDAGFEDAYVIGGSEHADDRFIEHRGRLPSELAYREDFQLRLVTSPLAADHAFYVDDIAIECTGEDTDGDGYGQHVDCNDNSQHHWFDCGACSDNDGDDFGPGCDLGEDCNDGDRDIHPGAVDISGDGDRNCDGVDGPALMADFEAPTVVDAGLTPKTSATVERIYVHRGFGALQLMGGTSAITETLDMNACVEVGWAMLVKRGPDAMASGDALTLDWWAGDGWRESLSLGGANDMGFVRHRGLFDAEATWASFSARLSLSEGSLGHVHVDDFGVVCDPVDVDNDGFWAGIEDCDDNNALVFPGAPETSEDGVDSNCRGHDGPG